MFKKNVGPISLCSFAAITRVFIKRLRDGRLKRLNEGFHCSRQALISAYSQDLSFKLFFLCIDYYSLLEERCVKTDTTVFLAL